MAWCFLLAFCLFFFFFFDESTFSIILWKLGNQLSCGKGRMRKVTTARGRGDAFNGLLQLFCGLATLRKPWPSCCIAGWPGLAKAEPQEPTYWMGQAPGKVLAVFLLRSRCLALASMERLAFFLSLSVTNGDEFVWTGSVAIMCPVRTGGIGVKWCWVFLSESTLWVRKVDRAWDNCLCYFCLLMSVLGTPVSLVDHEESQPACGSLPA